MGIPNVLMPARRRRERLTQIARDRYRPTVTSFLYSAPRHPREELSLPISLLFGPANVPLYRVLSLGLRLLRVLGLNKRDRRSLSQSYIYSRIIRIFFLLIQNKKFVYFNGWVNYRRIIDRWVINRWIINHWIIDLWVIDRWVIDRWVTDSWVIDRCIWLFNLINYGFASSAINSLKSKLDWRIGQSSRYASLTTHNRIDWSLRRLRDLEFFAPSFSSRSFWFAVWQNGRT